MPEIEAVGDRAQRGERPPAQPGDRRPRSAPGGSDQQREAGCRAELSDELALDTRSQDALSEDAVLQPPSVLTPHRIADDDHRRGREQRGRRPGTPMSMLTPACVATGHPQRDEHAHPERPQVGRQRPPRHGVPPLREHVHVPRRRQRDQRDHERHLRGEASRPEPQGDPADEREQRVERHLHAQRPHHGVEAAHRRRRVVLQEECIEGQLGRRWRDRVVSDRPVEDEAHRAAGPGGGHDSRRTAAQVRPGRHAPPSCQRGPRERAVQQVAREHEEADQPRAGVEEHLIEQLGTRAVRSVGSVQPDVEAGNRQRSDRANAVQPGHPARMPEGRMQGHPCWQDALPGPLMPRTPGPRTNCRWWPGGAGRSVAAMSTQTRTKAVRREQPS